MTLKLGKNKGIGIWKIDDCPSEWEATLYTWDKHGGYFEDGEWTEICSMRFDMDDRDLFFHAESMDDVWPMLNLKNIVKKLEELANEEN